MIRHLPQIIIQWRFLFAHFIPIISVSGADSFDNDCDIYSGKCIFTFTLTLKPPTLLKIILLKTVKFCWNIVYIYIGFRIYRMKVSISSSSIHWRNSVDGKGPKSGWGYSPLLPLPPPLFPQIPRLCSDNVRVGPAPDDTCLTLMKTFVNSVRIDTVWAINT